MPTKSIDPILSLIKEDRLRPSSRRGVLIESESDKGRVINSSAFRRLQQKAQVFPLDPNAAVRTRLTHSVEVSQVGRHIAQSIIQQLGGSAQEYARLAAFVNTVETACLLHDIGNPPFGHLGEAAIRGWFKKNRPHLPDLAAFDGNPHGFRLTTFLAGVDDFGLNLSASLLLSCVKYPRTLKDDPNEKYGIFTDDEPAYVTACGIVGWPPGQKFPLAQLMDAADDIAYSMSDLEDGLEKQIINLNDLKQEFGEEKFKSDTAAPIIKFKTDAINAAVAEASRGFIANIDAILSGQIIKLIPRQSQVGQLLDQVGTFARSRLYSHQAAEQVELAGKSVIDGLLQQFGKLLDMPPDDFMQLDNAKRDWIKMHEYEFHLRLLHRLPWAYRAKYARTSRGSEESRRAHLIVDFIAGMTDDFALQTFQIFEGIRV